jgi:NAD-dependent DNA ligase
MAAKILKDSAPYDVPQPPVVFQDRVFIFTGRFKFGTRVVCEQAVLDRNGLIPKSAQVSHVVDYLVVGAKGSEQWKHSGYGSKIEAAVVERSIHEKPAIITEEHWCSSL